MDIKEIFKEINKTNDIKELEELLFTLTIIKREVVNRRAKLIMSNILIGDE